MADSDATTTPRRPRGRPSVFEPETEELYRNMFPEMTTRRGRQNMIYYSQAALILKLPDAHTRFEWLIGPSPESPKHRRMVLAELGRLRDPAAIAAFAEHLCQVKHPPRLAAALIRQRVRKAGEARPTLPPPPSTCSAISMRGSSDIRTPTTT